MTRPSAMPQAQADTEKAIEWAIAALDAIKRGSPDEAHARLHVAHRRIIDAQRGLEQH